MLEIKKKEKNTVSFDIVLKNEDLKEAELTVYKKNKGRFQISGFRKGHVPMNIIKKTYGADIFLEDAVNEILPVYYEKAIDELGIEVVDQPKIELIENRENGDIVLEAKVDVKPEVKLGKYKGVEVENITYEVNEEIIASELENQRRLNARIVNVDDRAAKMGDKVKIDFVGTINGVPFNGGTAENQELELGSNTFIDGFEDQIVGHNIGDSFDVNVTFPENYSAEDLQGKDAVFNVKLNEISYEELPELDDEFIKDISEFDTIEEYKNKIKEEKEKEFEKKSKEEIEKQIINKVAEDIEVDIPEGMIKNQINSQIDMFERNLKNQGLKLESYLQMVGTNIEKFRETIRPDAIKQLRSSLAVEAIIEAEKLEVEENEIENEIDKIVKEYFANNEEQQDKMKEYMLKENKTSIAENLKNRKAIDLLFSNANLVDKIEKATEEENK